MYDISWEVFVFFFSIESFLRLRKLPYTPRLLFAFNRKGCEVLLNGSGVY